MSAKCTIRKHDSSSTASKLFHRMNKQSDYLMPRMGNVIACRADQSASTNTIQAAATKTDCLVRDRHRAGAAVAPARDAA
jgi:hypothetical protein